MRTICRHFLALFMLVLLPSLVRAQSPAVPQYGKFEASWTLPGQTGNPFDPRDNDVDVTFRDPRGRSIVVPAFWDGDRWRVRFAPTRPGRYALSVSRSGRPVRPPDLSARAFRCVPSGDPGFVRRDPKVTQRFVFDQGQTYYPLGMNVAWAGGNGPDYPEYFAHMGTAHMNWARVWMTFWDGKALEWSPDKTKNPPRGYFLLDAARRWDMIFDQAARNGVYVQMVLQHHGQYTAHTDPNWADNPFNAANGGFLAHPDDFFTDPEARRLTKAKYRYIVARWGYATHLLAFELFNEVQNINEAHSHFQDVVNWHREMAAYLRSLDPNHHLVTTSNSPPGDPLSQIGLDYDQVHTYPPDIVSTFAAVTTAGVTAPVFFGEWGPSDTKTGMTEQTLHDGLWASLADPTAGAGQFWYWDQVLPHGWWPQFASASDFVRMLPARLPGDMQALAPSVASPGPRASLSFAPPDGWAPTTRFDVTLDPGGQTPALSGIASFVQGQGHRDMLPRPITFHLQSAAPCRFQVLVGTVAKSGAQPTLSLDGGPAHGMDFPASGTDHDADQTLSLAVPPGAHTVALFNTGPDWFIAKQISVTDYAPAVACLAKGNGQAAVFWAYARDRAAQTPQTATLTLPGLAPGNYTVRLWDTRAGRALGPPQRLRTAGGALVVPLPPFTGDLAGAAEKDGAAGIRP